MNRRLPMKQCTLAVMVMVVFTPGEGWAQQFFVQEANAYAQRKDWNGLIKYASNCTRSDPNSAMLSDLRPALSIGRTWVMTLPLSAA